MPLHLILKSSSSNLGEVGVKFPNFMFQSTAELQILKPFLLWASESVQWCSKHLFSRLFSLNESDSLFAVMLLLL